ncbi:hypothetical protein THIOM_000672 [Candidatus Thiomargarita nelsonii]|uniref:Uncharacterized protein n=1 Tax=Candidatus Thiomargarita nelsonii TaxID=1003181 RepID=A0A176S6A8_9GAMM|nr:hypothetical protein THIOM_000672 [Candidatus Thiomargarita nelsonii]
MNRIWIVSSHAASKKFNRFSPLFTSSIKSYLCGTSEIKPSIGYLSPIAIRLQPVNSDPVYC